tara:strand:- start:4551 stop:4691 length:141 start_codon:yes stop_codon:yes gene_type:complete
MFLFADCSLFMVVIPLFSLQEIKRIKNTAIDVILIFYNGANAVVCG